jgi:hypothetical protein
MCHNVHFSALSRLRTWGFKCHSQDEPPAFIAVFVGRRSTHQKFLIFKLDMGLALARTEKSRN